MFIIGYIYVIFEASGPITLYFFKVNKMPRDKKVIHRSTSDVEDEVLSDEEPVLKEEQQTPDSNISNGSGNLTEERKKFLKDAILKRTSALKQQRESARRQMIHSTKKY